jgi:hypothetical protein
LFRSYGAHEPEKKRALVDSRAAVEVSSQSLMHDLSGHRGDGAVTIIDYIAIGVLMVSIVCAVVAVSGGKFKL